MPIDNADPSNVSTPRSADKVLAAQLALFTIGAAETFDRVLTGKLLMPDAADLLQDAAIASGLADSIGINALQKLMAAAFASASASRDKQQESKP